MKTSEVSGWAGLVRSAACSCGLAALAAGGAWGQDGAGEIVPAGLSVVWEGFSEAFDGFSTLNREGGVELVLVANVGGKSIVELDEGASEVVLLAGGKELAGSRISSFPSVSKDGKAVRFGVVSEGSPEAGATALRATGMLVLLTGSEVAAKRGKSAAVEEGGEVAVAEGLAFRISSASEGGFGDVKMEMGLEIKRAIPEVARFRFFDGESGKEIGSEESGSSSWSVGDQTTVTRHFGLHEVVKSVVVEVDVWTDLGALEVPVEVEVGLGGAGAR